MKRVFALLLAGSAMQAEAHAATPADFYKGRTLNVIIGYSPGGGYDLYARVLSQHLGKHIPGDPTVIPQNMPGAGSLKAANYLFSVAPKDGATIGTFSRTMGSAEMMGHARFDATKFSWLGSITKDTTLCISMKSSPIQTWDDAMTRQFVVGGGCRPRHLREALQERVRREDPACHGISGHERYRACHGAGRGTRTLRHFLEHRKEPAWRLAAR